jgi:hypothetical protein
VLRRLVQAQTLDELWDETQVLCVKDGVKRDPKEWSEKRFRGFKNAQNVQRIFVLGKGSILRKLASVESLEEVRRLCEESWLELGECEGKLFGKIS